MVEVGKARIYGVFDGHGGIAVANECKDKLAKMILEGFPNAMSDIPDHLTSVFLKFDRDLYRVNAQASMLRDITSVTGTTGHYKGRDVAGINYQLTGSTAIVAVLYKGTLFLANLGDSRAILVKDGKVLKETMDHKPNGVEEKARIQRAGGFVANFGVGRVDGVLAVSRAFGDMSLKVNDDGVYMGENAKVSPEPTIYKCTPPAGSTLVLACDGLWDVMNNQEVAKMVASGRTSEQLVAQALALRSRDNVSVMMVKF